MATAEYDMFSDNSVSGTSESGGNPAARRLHRIRTVRRQQGMSLRSVARHLSTDVEQLKRQENETEDLTLSDLYEWQAVLEVPVADLLVDPGMPLSRPVMERATLLRIMKTAVSILERSKSVGMRRMAQTLVDQLIEVMPELREVGSWPTVGQRRSLDEPGRIVERRLSEDLLRYDNHE